MDATKFVNKGIFKSTDEIPKHSLVVSNVRETVLDHKKKLMMEIEGSDFDFALNKGSIEAWVKRYGNNTDAWIGKSARVYKEDTYIESENTTVVAVRVVPL